MFKEENFVVLSRIVDCSLNRLRIICFAIAGRTRTTSTDEVVLSECLILRFGFRVVFSAVEEALWSTHGSEFVLELVLFVGCVFVALTPSFNSRSTSLKEGLAVSCNGDWNIVELDVL